MNPSSIRQKKSPLEILFSKSPNISHLCVFICFSYACVHTNDKFQSRSRLCEGWILFDPDTHQFLFLKMFIFESQFQFSNLSNDFDQPISSNFLVGPATYSLFEDFLGPLSFLAKSLSTTQHPFTKKYPLFSNCPRKKPSGNFLKLAGSFGPAFFSPNSSSQNDGPFLHLVPNLVSALLAAHLLLPNLA